MQLVAPSANTHCSLDHVDDSTDDELEPEQKLALRAEPAARSVNWEKPQHNPAQIDRAKPDIGSKSGLADTSGIPPSTTRA